MDRPAQDESWFTKTNRQLDQEYRARKSLEALEAQWEADTAEDGLTTVSGDPLLGKAA